jgi:hypothetical protein
MGAVLGEPGGRAPLLGALKVMKGRLWGLETPFMGAQATRSGLPYRVLREMVERGSGGGASLSLSVKGTWRDGSLAGDPGG